MSFAKTWPAKTWRAEVLRAAPMIAPARQFVYPRPVPGEEDALARGALLLQVTPREGGAFLATCALGYRASGRGDGPLSGVFATPKADVMCAVAGGYAYLVDTVHPEGCEQVPLRPVVQVMETDAALIFCGFHTLYVLDADGGWETPKLSWEGITLGDVRDGVLHGTGWEMQTDKDVPFTVDLRTRLCAGGGLRL